jgi:hypothetical protein
MNVGFVIEAMNDEGESKSLCLKCEMICLLGAIRKS